MIRVRTTVFILWIGLIIWPATFFAADNNAVPSPQAIQSVAAPKTDAGNDQSPTNRPARLPDRAQIQVLEKPSWWDGRHTLTLVEIMAIITLGAVFWVLTLRRRVNNQTALIRKRLEHEAAIEQSYREIFDGAHDLIYTQNLNGRITSINPAGLRILGFKREELKQLTIDDVVAPECREHIRRLQQPTEPPQGAHVCELEFIARSGQRVIVEASARLIIKNGTPDGVQVIARDITERKRIEMALAQTSSLLEVLMDKSPDRIYFKDRQSRFVRCSKVFGELFHVSDHNLLTGKTDFDFFTEEHARPAYEDEQEIIRTGKPVVGKLEKETHADGRVAWCLTTKLPWRDKDEKIIGTFGISKDVTSIKETDQKLAHEQGLFQTLIDNFPDVIYFKDLESRFVRVSRSKALKSLAIVLAHYRDTHPSAKNGDLPPHLQSVEAFSDYLIGKTDFDTYTEERARAAYKDEREIIRTGEPIVGKVERTPQIDGSVTWCISTKMPWRDKDEKIIGTLGVSKDITALKKAEAELESTNKRLLETSRLAGMAEVATDVLHNVGNVLNSVNVSSSLVIDRVKQSKLANLTKVTTLLEKNRTHLGEFITSDTQGKQIPDYLGALAECFGEEQKATLNELEGLRKNIDHIKQIVAMQQTYAKVAGVVERLAPTQLVEDALHINAAALSRHGVRVQRDFEELPPMLTEKHKVLQILVNLIRNAKYALHESDQKDKVITVKAGTDGNGHVKIQVIDNGMGISPENLTRIFGHGFTTRADGHGFGLHSSALAARDLGGSIHAHSDGLGKGATFTLLLPREVPNQIAKAA